MGRKRVIFSVWIFFLTSYFAVSTERVCVCVFIKVKFHFLLPTSLEIPCVCVCVCIFFLSLFLSSVVWTCSFPFAGLANVNIDSENSIKKPETNWKNDFPCTLMDSTGLTLIPRVAARVESPTSLHLHLYFPCVEPEKARVRARLCVSVSVSARPLPSFSIWLLLSCVLYIYIHICVCV